MGAFPPGGWDVDHCDDLTTWLPSLALLPPSKTLQAAIRAVRNLSYSISLVVDPAEVEDEGSEDEVSDAKPSPFAASDTVIKSRPSAVSNTAIKPRPIQKGSSSATIAPKGLLVNDPSVCLVSVLVLLY